MAGHETALDQAMKAATEAVLAAVEGELEGLAITEAQARVIAGYGITKFLEALPARFPLPGRSNRDCQWWGAAEGWHQQLAAEISRGQPWEAAATPALDRAHAALRAAADQFAFYADQHRAKGTPDGDQKAAVNEEWAARLRRVAEESTNP